MAAKRLRLLALTAILCASGCGWARHISWDLPPRDDPRDTWPGAADLDRQGADADSLKAIQEERGRKEAEFRARNPGFVPPGSRR